MRILQVVKTSDGAGFAAWQARELVSRGIEVHVALPRDTGSVVKDWKAAGATIHIAPLDFPIKKPWRLQSICDSARKLVAEVQPDVIHSHFVGTTLVLRLALGKKHPVPRLFQVAGPLHLEHGLYKRLDLMTAGAPDYWIASSRCLLGHYQRAGVDSSRLFLSYYGWPVRKFATERTNSLRKLLGISRDELVVGNICWMYAPKYFLGQTVGLKCHEDIIDALGIVLRRNPRAVGVLAGGPVRNATWYENRLRARAEATHERIRMPGLLPHEVVQNAWADFDLAVHVPISENCGGVLEPLLACVPVVASNVGGIPELVIDGVTGKLVAPRRPQELAEAILEAFEDLEHHRRMAEAGNALANCIFDVRRTAPEIEQIYRHVLDSSIAAPEPFSPPESSLIGKDNIACERV